MVSFQRSVPVLNKSWELIYGFTFSRRFSFLLLVIVFASTDWEWAASHFLQMEAEGRDIFALVDPCPLPDNKSRFIVLACSRAAANPPLSLHTYRILFSAEPPITFYFFLTYEPSARVILPRDCKWGCTFYQFNRIRL